MTSSALQPRKWQLIGIKCHKLSQENKVNYKNDTNESVSSQDGTVTCKVYQTKYTMQISYFKILVVYITKDGENSLVNLN